MFKQNKLTPLLLLLAGIILIVPISGGCGGEEASNAFLELMSLVPASMVSKDAPVSFRLNDYGSLFQDYGFSFETLEDLYDNIYIGYLTTWVTGIGSYITGYGMFTNKTTIKEKYIGYDAIDIYAEIGFLDQNYKLLPRVVAIGNFSPQATIDALNNQDEWPSWVRDIYATEEYRGITIHCWGDGLQSDTQHRFSPPHLDTLGRAMPLAVSERYLFSTAIAISSA